MISHIKYIETQSNKAACQFSDFSVKYFYTVIRPKINFLSAILCCDMMLIHYYICINFIYIFTPLFIEIVISSLRIPYTIFWSYSHPTPANARILTCYSLSFDSSQPYSWHYWPVAMSFQVTHYYRLQSSLWVRTVSAFLF